MGDCPTQLRRASGSFEISAGMVDHQYQCSGPRDARNTKMPARMVDGHRRRARHIPGSHAETLNLSGGLKEPPLFDSLTESMERFAEGYMRFEMVVWGYAQDFLLELVTLWRSIPLAIPKQKSF